MTDEQIIKADEQIIKALEHNASKCKFYEDGHDGGLFESTLDLIKRYKSENERLKQELDLSKVFHKEVVAERNLYLHQMAYHKNAYKTAKSEAIKEFAERLKGYPIVENESKEIAYLFVEVRDIDNLVKEMTEVHE
nr:MAG TPA: hypothetical protein [Caudoviricetes sp.]